MCSIEEEGIIGLELFRGGNYKSLIPVFFILLAVVMSTFFISGLQDISTMAMLLFSLAIVIATFVDTNIGLIAILLSMLLSPELEAGATQGRAVVVRAEDLILIIVSLTWLSKMAIKKELPVLRHSPLNIPIGLYCAVLFVATFRGVIMGSVTMVKGTFYVFKMIEYFILFFIVANHTTTVKQVKLFLFVLLLTGLIVGIYCNTHLGTVSRMSAPFEGSGEPNTLGGYLLLIMSIVGGMILFDQEHRKILILLFLFLTPPFLLTLSRASYLGIIPALFCIFSVTKKKVIIFISALFVVIFVLLIFVGPPMFRERVLGAFEPETNQTVQNLGPISLGPSPAARIESWGYVFRDRFPKRPLLGYGVSGTGFLDSQFILNLAETGIIGSLLFLWILWRIWKAALYSFHHVESPLFKGLVAGYLAGFIGILFHAIGSNSFIIIRIAEPFWFFTAIVIKLVDIESGKSTKEDSLPRYARFKVR